MQSVRTGKQIKNVFIWNMNDVNPLGAGIPFAEGKLNNTYYNKYVEFFKANGCNVTTTSTREVEDAKIKSDEFVNGEKKKWKEADLVIMQTPIWWFSVPAKSKVIIDDVFTRAMSPEDPFHLCRDDGRSSKNPEDNYATGGACQGEYMLSITSNAPHGAYSRDNGAGPMKNKSVDDLFLWLHGNMQFIGMKKIPDSTFQAYDVVKNPKFEEDIKRWEQHMNSMFVKIQ